VVCAHFCYNWGWYISLSWLPIYFNSNFHVELSSVGWFTLVPYVAMVIVGNAVGWIADYFTKRGVRIVVIRKTCNTIGLLGPAFFFLVLAHFAKTPYEATLYITCALACASFSRSGFWVNHLDISPQYSGHLMGLTNTFATIPGIIGNSITGWMLENTNENWKFIFWIIAAVYAIGALVFAIFAKGEVTIGAPPSDNDATTSMISNT